MKIIPFTSPSEMKNNYDDFNRLESNALTREKIKSTILRIKLYYTVHLFTNSMYKSRKLGSHIHKYTERERERKRDEDRFYCARMQAEESLGVQCTCSCYIELDLRAPPSWLQSEGEEGEQLVSQLFYSELRHRQYCATSIAPTVLPLQPSTRFFHLSTTTVSSRRRGKFHVAAVAVLHHSVHDE